MMEQGEQADESADPAELSSNIADTGLNSIVFFSHDMMPFERIYFTNMYDSNRIVERVLSCIANVVVFISYSQIVSFQNLTHVLLAWGSCAMMVSHPTMTLCVVNLISKSDENNFLSNVSIYRPISN